MVPAIQLQLQENAVQSSIGRPSSSRGPATTETTTPVKLVSWTAIALLSGVKRLPDDLSKTVQLTRPILAMRGKAAA